MNRTLGVRRAGNTTMRPGLAAALASLAWPFAAPAAITFVGEMAPPGDLSSAAPVGTAEGLEVSAQVASPGVTDPPGQGAGIGCFADWGPTGGPRADLAMAYAGDAGNRDRYAAALPTAPLVPGTYVFTVWCSDDGGETRVYRDGGDGLLTITPVPQPPPGEAIVQLFEWKWSDVAQECAFLAARGYEAVQVSPPSEHLSHLTVAGNPWWVRYQPMSYALVSRSGNAADFAAMVVACTAAGVDIYVDAVINHMTAAGFSALGTAGTFYAFNSYTYPGTWGPGDFHYCGTDPGGPRQHDILDFADRYQVQHCELFGLADLDTGAAGARATLGAYLQSVVDLGVAGFRIDAAKHMAASDLEAIFSGLAGAPYIYQEVIDSPSEQVRAFEYLPAGDVLESAYGQIVGAAFSGCGSDLADLAGLGTGLLGTDSAVVFIDDHDTQRAGGCIVTHQDGLALYDLANVFMLAHPYGFPRVMSSYYFSNSDAGPPATNGATRDIYVNGEPVGCNATEWVCEHRRTAVANLVAFRRVTRGEPLVHWWDDGGNRIAFGRGARGYVAINRTSSAVTRTWQTAMPAGSYCNVARYDVAGSPPACVLPGSSTPAPSWELVEVAADGSIADYALASLSALAIHLESAAAAPDADLDGVADDLDNCTLLANADQRDSNGDGYGNRCDPDLDGDGIVNFVDLGILRAAFFSSPGTPHWNPDADLDGDGAVNFVDLGILRSFFFGPPGPSAPPPPEPCLVADTGLDPAQAFGDVMFLRGDMAGGWAAIPGLNDFANLGGEQYAVRLELAAGGYEYKVANSGWSIERSNIEETLAPGVSLTLRDNGGGSPNGALAIPADACYEFRLDASDTDFPVLSLEQR
jgi:hypothetical protein